LPLNLIFIRADIKLTDYINEESIVFVSSFWNLGNSRHQTVAISWEDIRKIGFKKVLGSKVLFLCYPYDDRAINDGAGILSIDHCYCNHKAAWKEILSRSLKANPNVEIAEEFRSMFL
jgi:hypothetical protein